jgi:hypothetical protein
MIWDLMNFKLNKTIMFGIMRNPSCQCFLHWPIVQGHVSSGATNSAQNSTGYNAGRPPLKLCLNFHHASWRTNKHFLEPPAVSTNGTTSAA